MHITLKLFGAFRNYGNEIILSLPEKSTVADVRQVLSNILKGKKTNLNVAELIAHSRFSTDTALLEENTLVRENTSLALLPPVSGG